MALQEKIKEMIEMSENDILYIRSNRIIYDDVTGEVISQDNYHRRPILPHHDYSGESARVRAICEKIFTQESKDLFTKRMEIENKRVEVDNKKNKGEDSAAEEAELAALELEEETLEAAYEASIA